MKICSLLSMVTLASFILLSSSAVSVPAQDNAPAPQARRGPPPGRGPGFGRGFGRMHANEGAESNPESEEAGDSFRRDHEVFFYLLDHRDEIRREITNLENGIDTLTESDNKEVVAKIQEHVAGMYQRVENVNPIHMRDPLFRELFANAEKIQMEYKETDKGVQVRETSDDPYVARLLQEHAKVVSLFMKHGFDELHRNHPLPPRHKPADDQAATEAGWQFPVIADHGKIVQLADAEEQPRADTKICVDITAGGEPDKINPAIEKAARFVNIYGGAGRNPAALKMTLILHGDATTCALSHDAWHTRHETAENPNLALMNSLREAGVRILVCGQALSHKGIPVSEVAPEVQVAVSALTANVNHQQDGYVVVPLH
ncbi:MAG: DsrE family protein, partial [Planctomycetaceae bacterium]|nr:DsrE family protein [Planctomycetaceae bacterium]